LIRDIDSPVSFSPDGKQLVFMRGMPERSEIEIHVADSEGGNDPVLAALPAIVNSMYGADWSLDGKSMVAAILQPGGGQLSLQAINVADGKVKEIFSGVEGLASVAAGRQRVAGSDRVDPGKSFATLCRVVSQRRETAFHD
jgi:Tol biopolymer transport system component